MMDLNAFPIADFEASAGKAADLLRTLGNEKRLMILCQLGPGELQAGALQAPLGLSQSALSQHLAVLRADGLVRTRRESQTIHYAVRPGPALDVIRVLYGHYCRSAPRPGKRSQP